MQANKIMTKLWRNHDDRPNCTASVEFNPVESESRDTKFVQRHARTVRWKWIRPISKNITHHSLSQIDPGKIRTYWQFECAHEATTKAAASIFQKGIKKWLQATLTQYTKHSQTFLFKHNLTMRLPATADNHKPISFHQNNRELYDRRTHPHMWSPYAHALKREIH
jgi:hypothetical protein